MDKKNELQDPEIRELVHSNLNARIRQSANVTFLKGDIDKLQLSIIVSIMDSMQVEFEKYIQSRHEGKQSFSADDIAPIRFNLSTLGVVSRHYERVEAAIENIVKFNVKGDTEKTTDYIPLFSKISIPKEEVDVNDYNKKGLKRKPYIEFKVNPEAFDFFFNIKQYTTYLKETTLQCKTPYAGRLYQFISTYAYKGEWKVKYQDLRDLLGLNIPQTTGKTESLGKIKYPIYTDFRKRVLNNSMEELKQMADENKTDCYFTFTPIFKDGRERGNPEWIIFQIHDSEFGKQEKERQIKSVLEGPIGMKLKAMGLEVVDVFALVNKVPDSILEKFMVELNRIESYINAKHIKNRKAYINTSIKNFLNKVHESDNMQEAEEIKEPESMVAADVMANQPVITPEDQRKLNALGSAMHTFMKADDFLAWYCQAEVSVQDDRVVAKFPDKEMAAAFQEKYGELFTDNVKQIFWLGVKAVIE